MLRIQLVIEDYAELVGLSTTLKRVGFDVSSQQTPQGLAEKLLALNPDVLVMTARGRRVNGVEAAAGLRKKNGQPRVILIGDEAGEIHLAVDAWVPAPVAGPEVLDVIARICGLNAQILRDKYAAKVGGAAATKVSADQSRLGASTMDEPARRARYEKFLKGAKPRVHGVETARVREHVRALRAGEKPEENADLERERREFVEQLFKKKA